MTIELPTEAESVSAVALLILSIETRFGRLADAAEESTRQIARVADALESIAAKLDCVTETVETENGKRFGSLRAHDAPPNWLYMMKNGSDNDT